MKPVSKFFTQPLEEADRALLCRRLGLGGLSFRFVERHHNLVVRVRTQRGAESETHLKVDPGFASGADPLVIHRIDAAAPDPTDTPPSLWEEILPYPLSLVGRHFRVPGGGALSVAPGPFRAGLQVLWQALESLDARMATTEFACLWLEGAEAGSAPPLLVQYVRKRRVRLGLAPSLAGLGALYRAGELTPTVLLDAFGTHSAFYYLGLEQLADGPASVADRILRLLGQTAPVVTAHPLADASLT